MAKVEKTEADGTVIEGIFQKGKFISPINSIPK